MRDLDDTALERRLREVLKEHLGALPLDLTVETLDRRRQVRVVAPRFGRGRGMTLLAAATLLLVGGALVAGSGLLQRTTVTPSLPAPSLAQVAIASPNATPMRTSHPSASQEASPTPASLKLTWTQVALDPTFADGYNHTPRVAWVGHRFVLADMASGTVRTSTDGENWQALEPSDAAPGYVDLLGGSIASWQDTYVGLWHPQDGPDVTNAPPVTKRDVVTIAHPPAAPISTTPFRGRVESIGIGPKGIVAQVHSVLDPNANPGNDRGSAWYSPDGGHWTQARLPGGAFGSVVGVSDGFVASGGCAKADVYCSGMWFSSDGLTWRFLGQDADAAFLRSLVPWMGGALEMSTVDAKNDVTHDQLWTSAGKLPVPGDLRGTVGTGPFGSYAYDTSVIPAEMAAATHDARDWPSMVAVGDRKVLALEMYHDWMAHIARWSLWLGTFAP